MMVQEGVLLLTDDERVALREMVRQVRSIESWRWVAQPLSIGGTLALTTWLAMMLVWLTHGIAPLSDLLRSLDPATSIYAILFHLVTIVIWWFACTSVLYFGFSRRWKRRAELALDIQRQTLEGRTGIAKLKAFIRITDHFREFGNDRAVKKLLLERI